MRHRFFDCRLGLGLIFGLMLGSAAFAQNRSTAELSGNVTDPTRAPIPGVTVTVVNSETRIPVTAQTNEAGYYDVPLLQPGTYAVTFERTGFATARRQNIKLELDQTARIDMALAIGETRQVVEVTAVTPLVERDNSQEETVFSTELTQNLPLVGRDPSDLAILAPGTSTGQEDLGGHDPGRVNVSGNRAFTIQATVNGGSAVLPNSNNFGNMVPPLGAVSEFSVVQDNFSAEYGSGTSVLNLITKSGTNQWHGSAFEFFENDYLNARNEFAESKDKLRYNQFGGTIGGPVKKDKIFFFFSYQNTLTPSTSTSIVTVPTAAARNGDLSAYASSFNAAALAAFPNYQIPVSKMDPVATAALNYLPAANYGSGTTNNYYMVEPNRPKTPIYDGRGDWVISSSNQLSGTMHYENYSDEHTGQIPGPACYGGEYCGHEGQVDQQYQLSDRWTLSSTMINEFHADYVRERYATTSPSYGGNFGQKLGLTNVAQYYFPSFTIDGALPTSLGAGQHYSGAQNGFIYADNLSWVLGKHTLKIGGQFVKAQQNPHGDWGSPSFTFNGQFTGLGFADFLLGEPYEYSFGASPTSLGARRASGAAFVDDTWHVLPKLTLNLGLRYQYEGGFTEAHDRLSNFDPAAINPITGTPGAIVYRSSGSPYLQHNHDLLFAPRVGFAYSLPANTVLRGSYGIFFIPNGAQQGFNSNVPGYNISQDITATNGAPVFQLSDGPPAYTIPTAANRNGGIANGTSITWWPYSAPQPYIQEWQFDVQKQLGVETTFEIAYVGSKGTHLLFPRDMNQVPLQFLGPNEGDPQLLRPFTQYSQIHEEYSDGFSTYHALELKATRRFANGFTFQANYTWSKSIDNSSYDTTTGIGDEYQITTNPNLNKGPSQFDQTQRVVVSYVYDLPFGKGRKWLDRGGVLNAVLGGWKDSGSFIAHSGIPFDIFSGGPNLTGAISGYIYADCTGNPAGPKTAAEWFNTGAFSDPSAYRFGTCGRDIVRGPGSWDYDMALMKDFRLPIRWETTKIEFRADAFNLFNHPNLGLPNNTTDSSAFGTITSASTPRTLQVGAQIVF
jgi:outer membrane receptor protein involved in Fe transport